MATPLIAKELQASFRLALADAKPMRHEYLTLEHLLLALTREPKTQKILVACGANVKRLRQRLEKFLAETVERLPEGVDAEPQQTIGIERVLQRAAIHALSAEQKVIDGGDVLVAMFREDESHALFLLQQEGITRLDVLNYISHGIAKGPGRRGGGRRPGRPGRRGGRRGPPEGPARGLHREPLGRGRGGAHRPADRPRERARAHHPGALPPPQEQPDLRGRDRRRQDRHRRGPGAAHPRGEGARAARRARSSTRSTWARCSPAPSSAASSRSGSRRCSRRSQKQPGAILFIDEIHTIVGAGATSGGSHGRLEPAQAGARLGQAALHRLHHLPGVQGELRARPRAGAPLPEDRGRRADRRGHGADPPGPQVPLRGAPRA